MTKKAKKGFKSQYFGEINKKGVAQKTFTKITSAFGGIKGFNFHNPLVNPSMMTMVTPRKFLTKAESWHKKGKEPN